MIVSQVCQLCHLPQEVGRRGDVGEMNEAMKGNFKDMPEAENPAVNGLVNPDPLLELLAPNVPLSDQINIDTRYYSHL